MRVRGGVLPKCKIYTLMVPGLWEGGRSRESADGGGGGINISLHSFVLENCRN